MTRQEIRLHGMGGQGIITAGHLIGEAVSLHERREAVMTEDYSPYVTGGWSRADLVISDEPIDYPLVSKPDILIAMSQDGLDDNWKTTNQDCTIIVESGFVNTEAVKDRKLFAVPALSIAEELGKESRCKHCDTRISHSQDESCGPRGYGSDYSESLPQGCRAKPKSVRSRIRVLLAMEVAC